MKKPSKLYTWGMPRCEICGRPFVVQHLQEGNLFLVNHYCTVSIELRQSGGTLDDMKATLNGKNGNIYDS